MYTRQYPLKAMGEFERYVRKQQQYPNTRKEYTLGDAGTRLM
jgi:hypothetical protein